MKIKKNIFDNYLFLTLSNIIKIFLLPPFFFNLIKQIFKKKRPKKFLQFWRNQELKIDYLVMNNSLRNIDKIITKDSISREAGKYKKNQDLEFIDIKNFKKIQFGITAENFVQNFSLISNGKEIFKIKGKIPSDRWVEAQIETKNIKNDKCNIKFNGNGSIFISNLIKINNYKKLANEKKSNKNIIVLLVDSLMPKHLDFEKNGTFDTPNIDNFFEKCLSFEKVYTQGDYTLPTVSSIMTGLYPHQHGVFNPYAFQRKIPKNVITLGEILKQNNYINYAHSTGGRFLPSYNHHRGFDYFKFSETHTKKGASIEIIKDAVEFIETYKQNKFFTFLHFNEVHPAFGEHSFFTENKSNNIRFISPGRANFHNKFNNNTNTEEEMLNYEVNFLKRLDFNLGYLFNCLKINNLIDKTSVILTSDHGRGHYKDKDFILKKNRARIPLKIKMNNESRIIYDIVEGNVDLFDTILEISGSVNKNSISQGRNIINLQKDNKKYFAITESPFIDFYEITIRDFNWLFVYKCKRNTKSDEIYLNEKVFSGLFKIKNNNEDYSKNYQNSNVKEYNHYYKILENHIKLKKYY